MIVLALIKQHQAELEKWGSKAEEVGLFIARDAWDSLENEVEDYTENGITWGLIEEMPYSWSLHLGMAFDKACEKWIEERLHALDETMQEAMGERWCYDINRNVMQNLQQALRIGNQLEARFTKLLKQAKPGWLEIARRAWFDDVDYALEHMEEDKIKDGMQVRQQFYAARNSVAPKLASVATELLKRSVQLYQTALAHAAAVQVLTMKPAC